MSEVWISGTGLTLRSPGYLALALLPALLALWRRRQRAPAVRFAAGGLLGRPWPRSWRVALLALPRGLGTLGLLLAIFALARPARSASRPLPHEGLDLLLCLDTSSSMTRRDMGRPTRLALALQEATAFIGRRPDDRIGLLTFARYPDLRCPPTLDHRALVALLDQVRAVPGDDPEDATGLGNAVAQAAQVLAESPPASRVLVLLTDGEENVALQGKPGEIAPAHAAQLCRKLGVRVYVILAGPERRNAAGALVKPDERPVLDLAARTAGAFFRARDAAAMESVYEQIDTLEKAPLEEPRRVLKDAYLPFLLAALVLLLLGRLLASSLLEVLP